jgi:monoamine oxidase
MDSTEHNVDTVIIGAGLAGLTAARRLESHNAGHRHNRISYAVLEASPQIGGRVQSDTITTEEGGRVKIEKGAQWLHKDIDHEGENPLIPHVRKSTRLVHDDMPGGFWDRGQRVNYNGTIQRINRARALINAHSGGDISLERLFEAHALGGNSSSLNTTFGPVETGAPLRDVSTRDVQALVPCNMGEFTRDQLSTFIRDYAEPVRKHIKTDSPVRKIKWKADGEKGVEITTADGETYHARQAIITVSVGVLKAREEEGGIVFEPPLPDSYRDNLEHIKMGNFNKLFLVFDNRFKFPVNSNTHLDVRTKGGDDIFYLARDNGQPLVTAFMGDDLARLCDTNPGSLEDLDTNPTSALATAIRGLAEIWGEEVRDHIVKTHVTRWGNEPYVKGGYSRVDVGSYHVRQALAEPVENMLFFAGEAMGAQHPGTGRDWATHMPGAALSGERAANAVIAAVEKIRPLPDYIRLTARGDVGAGWSRA